VRDDRERLADVLAAIDRIRRYVHDDRTRFDTDELLESAVLSLERDYRRSGTRRRR
jgi:uncharacterized protein with HEPN domain